MRRLQAVLRRRARLTLRGAGALALVAAALWLASAAGEARAARPLVTGFYDGAFASSDAGTRRLWLDRSVAVGARIVRIEAFWRNIAPEQRPAGFRAGDPGEPAYRWATLDDAVRDAAARRLKVLLTIERAPRWAEGAGAGRFAGQGTWRPSPRDLADFARAAARRYSGRYAAPSGDRLPRVRYWQVWNEPNLSSYLSPQGPGSRPTSGLLYRRMLNAAYAALKAVRRDNFVVAAGTAPYGDLTGDRTAPVRFMRQLLCVSGGRRPRAGRCGEPVRFDAWAHHPYATGSPSRPAYGPDDVAVPDLWKLRRLVRAASRGGTLRPRGAKALWITEISWDSRPPDPDGVPAGLHARWLADALFSLWRQGASTLTWLQVGDAERGPGWEYTYQSGVYLRDGRPKPAAAAFRFPLVVDRRGRRRLVWGRAPGPGTVTIERCAGSRWRRVARLRTSPSGVFEVRLALRRGRVRARLGHEVSMARSVGRAG